MGGLSYRFCRRFYARSPHFYQSCDRGLSMGIKFPLLHLLFILNHKEVFGADEKCSAELSAETRLRKALFCNYDKMVRPVKFFENQTLVQFQLYPTKIYMDEHEEVVEFQGNILYVWTDAFLKWDPREYEGIDFIRVSSNEIWVPDITVDTWSQSTMAPSMTDVADCHLAHVGNVYCFMMTTLKAPCTPDITFYPFDHQNCTLTFSSSGFVGKYVNFTLFDPKNGIKMTLYKPNVFWELKEATALRQVNHLSVDTESVFYPLIKCTFILRRHSAGHAAVVILPAAVLASLSLLIFWMDTMYETRINIAAIIILSDVIYCIYLGFILPSNGNKTPVIVTFYRDSLIVAATSIMITVLIRHLREKARNPARWMADVIDKMESNYFLNLIFLEEKVSKEEDAVEILENEKKKYSVWSQVATLIDRVTFYFLCLTYLILVMIGCKGTDSSKFIFK